MEVGILHLGLNPLVRSASRRVRIVLAIRVIVRRVEIRRAICLSFMMF